MSKAARNVKLVFTLMTASANLAQLPYLDASSAETQTFALHVLLNS